MKAFLVEEGSEAVIELLSEAGPSATSRLAYVECQAAFARGRRERRLSGTELSSAARNLDEQWPDMIIIELDSPVARHAGRIVHERALRASDAVHLASAMLLAEETAASAVFACWDARLWDAASELGLQMAPQSRPA